MKKYSYSLLFIAILLVQSAFAQVIDLRARQRNDQKVELEWFFKGENIITSLERKENLEGMDYGKIADINLSDEIFIDDFNFNPNSEYHYRFTYNGETFQKKVITYDFSAFDLLPPSDVVFYKSEGNIHLFWTDVTHREEAYLVVDESSNVLATVGPNETHFVFEDEGWDEIYVVAKGSGIESEKIIASQIAVIDFESELSEEELLVTVCPNIKYKNGVESFSYVDGNVSGFIDFLIQDAGLRDRIDVIKLYSMVHLLEEGTVQKLVSFQEEYGKMIALETGGIRQKNGVDKTQIGETMGAHTFEHHFLPIINAGGTINYIETDNAALFSVWGGHEPGESITTPLNLTSSEIARELADYFEYIYQRSPETKFGIIENLHGWNFGEEWKGKRTPVGGSQKGIEDILIQLNFQMRRKGLVLNHFTAELPYQHAESFGFDDYQYKKMLAVSDFCTELGINFSKLYNPNMQTSSNEEFFNSVTQFYVKVKEEYKTKTSIDIFQSWIAFPTTMYGDEDPYSFTNIVKALIEGPTFVEMIDSSNLLVYPNPVESDLHIVNDSPLESVKIYSILGSLMIYKDVIEAKELILGVSELQNGLYLLEVNTKEGRILKKIIKN